MNSSSIEIGPVLSDLKEFAKNFPPELKSLAITNNEAIRAAHNAFAKPDSSSTTTEKEEEDDDVYHYISYLPLDGIIYELDGLKQEPISLGRYRGEPEDIDWVGMVQPVVQDQINRYLEKEVQFSLLAVVKNRKEMYQADLKEYQIQKERIQQQMDDLKADEYAESRYEAMEKSLSEVESGIEAVKRKIAMEEEKSRNWKTENTRRKHNYTPFLFKFLKVLGDKKMLKPLTDKAKRNT